MTGSADAPFALVVELAGGAEGQSPGEVTGACDRTCDGRRLETADKIFADKEHLARSAMQLTLMQLTRMSLADVIKKAEGQHPGTVYSAIPTVQGGRPVVDVLVATRDGQSKHVTIELK